MHVTDIMTPREEVVTVEVPGSRNDVLEYLQNRTFSSVPVVKQTDDGELFRGIVSRSALIEHPDEDQLALLAEEVATTSVDTTVTDVAGLMIEQGERRVPVVDGDILEGIITVTDVVRAIANGDLDGSTHVEAVATEAVNAVYSGTPLPVAERELSYARVPYAVVLDDEAELAGMVTEVDILDVARVVEGEERTGDSIANEDSEWAWEGIKAVGNRYMPTRNVEIPSGPVAEFMTADLVTVGGKRTAQETAQLMLEHGIEQIPMLSGDQLRGIVRDIDLLEGVR
ncbi:MAG: CBS domain-containing protein [Halovenus sp.]